MDLQKNPSKKRGEFMFLLMNSERAPMIVEKSTMNADPNRVLNVVQFAESRSFEIKSMESALKSESQFVGPIRVFQRLPRHQRRRAASHNAKRLPQAWRQRAIDQMAKDPSGPREPAKTRRSKRRRHGETFEKRKANGEWLETHVWQAKRMSMIPKWGFKLACHPNDKNFRASYRASKHQCLINDLSYYSVYCLKGLNVTHFQHHVDPTIYSFIKTHSNKMLTFDFYLKNQYPFNTVGPVHLCLMPNDPILFVHPACKEDVMSALESYLPDGETLQDARNNMCLFELTGPRSHAILSKVLTPIHPNDANFDSTLTSMQNTKVWNNLQELHSPTALPPGCILSFLVQDPRLSYPPKMSPRTGELSNEERELLIQTTQSWPVDHEENQILLHQILEHSFSKITDRQTNQRKENHLIPGTPLIPLNSDPAIPIFLFQRGNIFNQNTDEFSCGWTLMIPKSFAMPFWISLTAAGARPIGLRERQWLHFENQLLSFPHDYAGSKGYQDWVNHVREEKELEQWKKPPAKRLYFEPWIHCPFEPPFWSWRKEKYSSPGLTKLGWEVREDIQMDDWSHRYNNLYFVSSLTESELIQSLMQDENKIHDYLAQKQVQASQVFLGIQFRVDGKGCPEYGSIIHALPNNVELQIQLVNHDTMIGFVTRGGYSYHLGKGMAFGYIQLEKFMLFKEHVLVIQTILGRRLIQVTSMNSK